MTFLLVEPMNAQRYTASHENESFPFPVAASMRFPNLRSPGIPPDRIAAIRKANANTGRLCRTSRSVEIDMRCWLAGLVVAESRVDESIPPGRCSNASANFTRILTADDCIAAAVAATSHALYPEFGAGSIKGCPQTSVAWT